ncbi:YARHG domain-containing protein [Lujinxingia vulgaris]|nr:YARHG domain-containing protein [Lujinxingia vulgaris]
MACHPRQAIASRYCETCAGEPACPTEDATLEARLTSQPDIAGFACEEYGYAINAILALHGQSLDDASWQGYLAAQPWYTPRSPTPLRPASTANLSELRAALKACHRTNPTTPDDRAQVADWFKTFESTGVPPASPIYSFDGAPTSADTFTAIIDQLTSEGGFAFTRRTPLRAHGEGGTLTLRPSERASAAPEGIPYARMLDVRPHLSAMMSCAEPERCEGYARLTLYLDADGELLAQDITAAE